MPDYDQLAYNLRRPLTPLIAAELNLGQNCEVFNSGAIALTTATNTVLTFDSESWDNGGFHSTVTNTSRLTVPVGGLYLFTGHVEFASNATGYRQIYLQLNGSIIFAIQRAPAVNGSVSILSIAAPYLCASSDYAELFATQTSGGNLNVDAANFYTPYFTVQRIA